MQPTIADTRRQFIKTFTLGTALSALGGALWKARVLADTVPDYTQPGTLTVRVSDFPALANENGSIRLALNLQQGDYPIFGGRFWPVAINRGPGNTFYALNTRCYHLDCIVGAFSPGDNAMVCPCHDSRYTISGARISGPSSFPLDSYAVTFDGVDLLKVTVPNLRFSVREIAVHQVTGPTTRLRLTFLSNNTSQYEILWRPNLTAGWTSVPYAISPSGGAVHTVPLMGDGGVMSVYVDNSTDQGYYTIAIKVIET